MDIFAILAAALVMSALGLVFGALLGVTGRVFAVPTNPKVDALRECLPGANCGACGFPGCDGYAAAAGIRNLEIQGATLSFWNPLMWLALFVVVTFIEFFSAYLRKKLS